MKQACNSVKLYTDPRQHVPLSCVVISVYGTYNKRVRDTTMKSIICQTFSSVLPILSNSNLNINKDWREFCLYTDFLGFPLCSHAPTLLNSFPQ
jgi:hypothetical protein